jgi:hypothetical protein
LRGAIFASGGAEVELALAWLALLGSMPVGATPLWLKAAPANTDATSDPNKDKRRKIRFMLDLVRWQRPSEYVSLL